MTITSNVRIREIKELITPDQLMSEVPLSASAAQTVLGSRQAIHRILHEMDDRLLVIIGPCSIHDPKAAMEYANRLFEQCERFSADLEVVMRVYFEKPRTTVGLRNGRCPRCRTPRREGSPTPRGARSGDLREV